MKLLCLVALVVCAVAHGAVPQDEILASDGTLNKDFGRSQYELYIPAPNINEISEDIPSQYESQPNVENRVVSDAITEALEDLRQLVINGNDNVPPLDPLEVASLGPFEYRLTGVRAVGTIHDLRMDGLRWFVADRIDVVPTRLTLGITLTVPRITATGSYETNARIGLLTHEAGGNFRVFVHRVDVDVDMRMGTNLLGGHLVLRALDIRIDIHDTQITITGMTGSTVLNSLISSSIQNLTQDLIQNEMETVSAILSEELFDVINEVLRDYTVSDIFG